MEKIPTKKLEKIAKQAELHAEVYRGTKDGSYEACLASYNYHAVKKELARRTKCE